MCRQHAKLIDNDSDNFSAATIKQWKIAAEKITYQKLEEFSKEINDFPLTFVSLGSEIIFEGFWKSAKNNNWIFEINNFLIGDINKLKEFSISKTNQSFNNYIVIETQGDGRLLDKVFSWKCINGKYEIEVAIQEKQPREDPRGVGSDIALGEDGDFKMIAGIECAKQIIVSTLSIGFGDLLHSPLFGSNFSAYFWKFKDNIELLNRILMIEITRLVSIPSYEPNNPTPKAPLNFINRIIEVKVLDTQIIMNRIPIKLKLEWGNREIWEDEIKVYIRPNYEDNKNITS